MPHNTLKHGARICARSKYLPLLLPYLKRTGQEKASSSEINSPVSELQISKEKLFFFRVFIDQPFKFIFGLF